MGSDGAVLLFKGGSYEPLRAIRHSAEERTIRGALSANGTTVVTGGLDGRVRVWDAATGTLRVELSSQKRLDGLAVGPSGDVVAVGDGNVATILGRRRATAAAAGLRVPGRHHRPAVRPQWEPSGVRHRVGRGQPS